MHVEAAVELCALGVGKGPFRLPAVGVDPARLVVDRHPALPVVDLAGKRRGRVGVIGHQELRDAPVEIGSVGLAAPADHEADVMAQHLELRPGIVLHPADAIVGLRLVRQRGLAHRRAQLVGVGRHHLVQEREVRGVDAAFEALHPVAVLPLLGDVAMARRHEPELDLRQLRHVFLRAHIDPDQVGPFAHRIGEQLDRVLVRGLRRRGRQVDAVAVDIELPAVEGAAQPAILVASVIEIGAAMRTMRLDDADLSVGVAKGQQLLAQDLDLLRGPVALRQFFRQQRRHPEAAQQIAHRRAGTAARQEFVIGLAEHQSPNPYLSPT